MAAKKIERSRPMTREQIQAALKQLGEELHAKFEDEVKTHGARLEQLDAFLANVSMAVDHLFDEEEREVDFAVRFLEQEADKGLITSPVAGRDRKHFKVVAGRAR
jgi:hypothetical protein